ncbi:DUF2599 domain-containing protein [Microbacterium sp. Root553]|uniref:DUF2599 domain-containing protein n=1 Tax=Microbacterium sp. Root553 TaxID=1736556 RepID=UPI003FA58DEE
MTPCVRRLRGEGVLDRVAVNVHAPACSQRGSVDDHADFSLQVADDASHVRYRQQYDCHTVYAAGKNPWNLERWRGTNDWWGINPQLCNW